MKVSPSEPFKIVYSILNHEYLGYIFESFVVQLNQQGEFSFQIQNISSKNIKEFRAGIDATDFELVKLIDDIQQDTVLRKFNPKKLNAVDFFLKVYDPQKGDKAIQEAIAGYLESCKAKILEQAGRQRLFIMGSDGNPLWKPVILEKKKLRSAFILYEMQTIHIIFPQSGTSFKNWIFNIKMHF